VSRLAAAALGLLLCAALLAPATAQACAVCFDPNDTTRNAYAYTALFMTLLPLALAGGLFWWIRRRAAMLAALSPTPQMNGISRAK